MSFTVYPDLFPELKCEIRQRCSMVSGVMLAMTCKYEWNAVDSHTRTRLFEGFVREGKNQIHPLIYALGVRHPYFRGSSYISFVPDHGAKRIPVAFLARLRHAIIEWSMDTDIIVKLYSRICLDQQQPVHICHLCCRAVVRGKNINTCEQLYIGYRVDFPVVVYRGTPDEWISRTKEKWVPTRNVILTYAFYQNDPVFLKQLLDRYQDMEFEHIQIYVDHVPDDVYHIPIREVELLDSIQLLNDYQRDIPDTSLLRINLICGMIQKQWTLVEIQSTLNRFTNNTAVVYDGWFYHTDVVFIIKYLKYCIAWSHPTAARFFWNNMITCSTYHDEPQKSVCATISQRAAHVLIDSDLPDFIDIVPQHMRHIAK